MKEKKQKTRKQMRQQKRKQKKINNFNYHHRTPPPIIPTHQNKKNIKTKSSFPQNELQVNKKKITQMQNQPEELHLCEDDKQIEKYEQKLGIQKGNKKYKKVAMNLGYDDDLFDFLDGISAKVNTERKKEMNEMNEKMEKMEKKKLKNQEKKRKVAKEANEVKQEKELKKIKKVKEVKEVQESEKRGKADENENVRLEIQKQMNGLFNKVSDGNLMYTFKSFVQIFENYPKVHTISIFSSLFVKFNLMIEKPLLHVLTANVVIAVSLHKTYGQRLIANLLYSLSIKFRQLQNEQQDEGQIEQIGYSRIFERRKNYILIICYLYEFGSICGEFIYSLVEWLTRSLDEEKIQFIYIIVQKCGVGLRNKDTTILKKCIEVLKGVIQQYKVRNNPEQSGKLRFIQIELNQIRFNRKNIFDADQRMGFLHTFLSKNVPKQVVTDDHVFTSTFDQLLKVDNCQHLWWEMKKQMQMQMEDEDEGREMKIQNKEILELKELAKSYRFVTEMRKNIFIQIMSSRDYLEATQKLLQMKVKKLEDIAIVLIEVNLREPTFNPFYALVGSKLSSQIPKLRVTLQFCIWDRIKQLDSFDVRKISNLGKFMSWLISSEISNCSLSMLKFFPDLQNVSARSSAFINVFFNEFFDKVKEKTLIKLANKLREERNTSIRQNIKQYLPLFKTKTNYSKVKFLRHLLDRSQDDD